MCQHARRVSVNQWHQVNTEPTTSQNLADKHNIHRVHVHEWSMALRSIIFLVVKAGYPAKCKTVWTSLDISLDTRHLRYCISCIFDHIVLRWLCMAKPLWFLFAVPWTSPHACACAGVTTCVQRSWRFGLPLALGLPREASLTILTTLTSPWIFRGCPR